MMTCPGDPNRHFFMTRSVARVMGLSILDTMRTGRLSREDYLAMVTRCQACPLVEACEEWLSSTVPGHAEDPLPGCANATRLHALRRTS